MFLSFAIYYLTMLSVEFSMKCIWKCSFGFLIPSSFPSNCSSFRFCVFRDLSFDCACSFLYSILFLFVCVFFSSFRTAVSNPIFAISQLAQTTMRSEIGKLSLDSTFEEREQLNMNIVEAIKPTGMGWGMDILRYEIRDIQIPDVVRHAMDLQAEAERQKRKQILQSEGERQSDVNIAEGRKRATVLRSEAEMEQNINFARGEAESIRLRAKALAEGCVNSLFPR